MCHYDNLKASKCKLDTLCQFPYSRPRNALLCTLLCVSLCQLFVQCINENQKKEKKKKEYPKRLTGQSSDGQTKLGTLDKMLVKSDSNWTQTDKTKLKLLLHSNIHWRTNVSSIGEHRWHKHRHGGDLNLSRLQVSAAARLH